MAISNAATREVFEAITTTFEDRLDREARKARTARTVGTVVVVILTAAMVLGGQFLTW